MENFTGQFAMVCNTLKVPALIAGDIFDKPDPTARMLNCVLEWFQDMFEQPIHAIPGQHDLENHNLDNIQNTGYWTLQKAGAIVHLENGKWGRLPNNGPWLVGYPWGVPLRAPAGPPHHAEVMRIAMCHKYVWQKDCSYEGAPATEYVDQVRKDLDRFDVAIFGDNHTGFVNDSKLPRIVNNGTFIRRRSRERGYHPRIHIILASGKIVPWMLVLDGDEMLTIERPATTPAVNMDIYQLAAEIERLGEQGLDFLEMLRKQLTKKRYRKHVRKFLLKLVNRLTDK